MVGEVNLSELRQSAATAFHGGYMCSETLVYVLDQHYDLGMGEEAIAMSTGFPFGFGNGGNVCGAVAGATMCLGKVFGRVKPGDPRYEKCCALVRELNDAVIARYETTVCPSLIRAYSFKTPERKAHCTGIVLTVVDAFTRIMERECGVRVPMEEGQER